MIVPRDKTTTQFNVASLPFQATSQKHDAFQSQLEMFQRIVLDQEQELNQLRTENWQLREQATEVEELREENTIVKQQLLDAREQVRRYETKESQRLYQEKHQDAVLRNPDLAPAEKLVGLQFLKEIAVVRDDPHDEVTLTMEKVAGDLGISTWTLRRTNKKMSEIGAWAYNIGKPEFKDGQYHTPVSIAMRDFYDKPGLLQKPAENKQGGPRERKCKNPACDSTDLDRYGLEYCRTCQKVHVEMLPGLRNDANVYEMLSSVAAGDCSVAANLTENLKKTVQKHDAFLGDIDNQAETENSEKHDALLNHSHQDQLSQSNLLPLVSISNSPSMMLSSKTNNLPTANKNTDCTCCPDITKGQAPKSLCWHCGQSKTYIWHHTTKRWICVLCNK